MRPEYILKKALSVFLRKFKDEGAEYVYISEQFRSIRQDLLIQHIKNSFTVRVYEKNVKIALYGGDVD